MPPIRAADFGGVEKWWELQYNNTMKKIDRVHDKMFTNVFGKVDNARALLKKVLPEEIKKRIDSGMRKDLPKILKISYFFSSTYPRQKTSAGIN